MDKVRGFKKMEDEAIIPTRATKYSAGYDLHSLRDYILYSGTMVRVETGIAVYMPPDEWFAIVPRSGLCLKHGITVDNSPAVIDSDFYPKAVSVLLRNNGDQPFRIRQGDRVAQGIFMRYLLADDDDTQGERLGGFGHTGVSP